MAIATAKFQIVITINVIIFFVIECHAIFTSKQSPVCALAPIVSQSKIIITVENNLKKINFLIH